MLMRVLFSTPGSGNIRHGINIRTRLRLTALALFFLGLPLLGLPGNSQKPKRASLNFLLVTIDTLRADRLSCYGSALPKTPNIDRLRERGVLFSRAFANTSTTLPSHANILLGTTPNHHGVHENLNFVVREELLTLAEHLKNNGYSTGAFVGAYPLDARFGLSQGFDVYDDRYSRLHAVNLSALERNAGAVVEAALGWLKSQVSPWFLWIHCWDPHTPYDPPEPFRTEYADHPYEGEVAYVDFALGKLFAYLDESGLSDSALVILTGDHGESLGQHGEETHGYFAYNSSLWVPLIIAPPEHTGGRCDDHVSHVDLFPTVCDLLGIETPPSLHGTSLAPALKGKRLRDRPIYIESLYPYYSHGWAPLRGFIFREKKFIDSPIPEVYDLKRDFDEQKNLAEGENIPQLASQLRQIIGNQTPKERVDAARQADWETREKLASLGYVASVRTPPKKDFTPQDDVKVLLPYVNKIGEGWKLYKQGQKETGIGLLKSVIEERKDIDFAYKQLATIYQEVGNTEEAIAVLERGLEVLPASYQIFIEYMKTLVAAQQFDRAIRAGERMNLREADWDPEIWSNLGTAYARTGQYEKAIKAFETGLSLDDRHPELYNNLANACYSYGLKERDRSVFSRSFEYYKKAIELDPLYPAPYFGLGHAYREEGNLTGAIYCWEKALEVDSNFRRAQLDLAVAYLHADRKDKSLELLNDYKRRYAHLLSPVEREQLENFINRARE